MNRRSAPISTRQPSSRTLLRFGAVAVFASLGAGCSADAVRLTDPIFTSSTSNQQNIIAGQASYGQPVPPRPTNVSANRTGVIQRQPLPEPAVPTYQAAVAEPVRTVPVQASAGAPRPYTPPRPYAASGQPKPLGTLPARTAARDQTGPAASSGPYVVQSGDSLWSIANRHGTSVAALQNANGLSGSSLKIGQRLVLPGDARGVQVAAVSTGTMTDAPRPIPAPTRRAKSMDVAAVQPRANSTPVIAKQPVQPKADVKPENPADPVAGTKPEKAAPVQTASTDGPGFRWPVKGRVISGFGKKANGERNDGIDLAVPEGTNVKAAESGVVIYAGNELKSYGNLVLVRHENGWVSAYAHNKDLLVKRGEKVQRGQVISRAGRTGGVDTPQVHFELRKGATPVDPMKHLSAV